MSRLPRPFYEGPTVEVARRLLGKTLVRCRDGGRVSGKVVEVEAYRGFDDPASHAFVGMNSRNASMYRTAGHAYVYFTYGFHHCLNVVSEPRGVPGAVLIRALEPLEGLRSMKRLRSVEEPAGLCSGPGKLTEALAIDLGLDGEDLASSDSLFLEDAGEAGRVGRSSRVGISQGRDRRWRFFLSRSAFVSHGSQNP